MALMNRELDRAVRRRFVLFDRLGMLDRRGIHLVDPWPIGRSLGMTNEETEALPHSRCIKIAASRVTVADLLVGIDARTSIAPHVRFCSVR